MVVSNVGRKNIGEYNFKQAYRADFYRMTGTVFTENLRNYIQIVFRHNLRYMWWWRHSDIFGFRLLAKLQLFRYSRKYGLEIGKASIGPGIYLGHPYNITVSEGTVIGKNVNLHKGVTIGRENRNRRRGVPIIGDCVFVGINSTIVGNITIGNDVMIASNSFVNFDVPEHSVVIGNPARIFPKKDATTEYINYRVN